MSVAVYPRLGELLRVSNLTMEGLGREFEQRFGLSVDLPTLHRLTQAEPIRQADLELVAAVAAILGVALGDLFRVEATPLNDQDQAPAFDLDPEQSRRLAELLDLQDKRESTPSEQSETDGLVAEWGRRLHEAGIREIAKKWGRPLEETRHLAEAIEWWRAFEADPRRQRAVVAQAKRHCNTRQN
jgi:hypothetical protein